MNCERLCPVDLADCLRPECATGVCELSGEPALGICQECGVIETRFGRMQICYACIGPAVAVEEKEN